MFNFMKIRFQPVLHFFKKVDFFSISFASVSTPLIWKLCHHSGKEITPLLLPGVIQLSFLGYSSFSSLVFQSNGCHLDIQDKFSWCCCLLYLKPKVGHIFHNMTVSRVMCFLSEKNREIYCQESSEEWEHLHQPDQGKVIMHSRQRLH